MISLFEQNELVKLLGTRYPILQGGMAWASDSKLACAVSNAGGLGIIGCGGRDVNWIAGEIVKSLQLSNHPIGLNFPLDSLADDVIDNLLRMSIEMGVKIFTLSGSRKYLQLFSKYGSEKVLIPVIGNVMEAKLCERAGAKAVICEGQESGGSIGRLSSFALIPQVVDAVSIPVIAAGGIADSRGLRAAFTLGAKGVQLGTRFLASTECGVLDAYKQRIVRARDTDTAVLFNRINRPARVLRNKFAMEYLNSEHGHVAEDVLLSMSKDRLKIAAQESVDLGALMAGEVAGLIHEIKPVSEIIQELIQNSNIDKL
jgi:enoyl-[acyl-carrier protein] reductase II